MDSIAFPIGRTGIEPVAIARNVRSALPLSHRPPTPGNADYRIASGLVISRLLRASCAFGRITLPGDFHLPAPTSLAFEQPRPLTILTARMTTMLALAFCRTVFADGLLAGRLSARIKPASAESHAGRNKVAGASTALGQSFTAPNRQHQG